MIREGLNFFSTTWSMIHILVLFVLFFESRYPRNKTRKIIMAVVIPMLFINLAASVLFGREFYGRLVIFLLVIPSFLFFILLAKYRDARFVFTFCTVDTISAEIILFSILVDTFLGNDKHILMLIIQILAFPIIEYLGVKYLRNFYFDIQNSVKRGWGIFALVSLSFLVIIFWMTTFPTFITRRQRDIPIILLVMSLMPIMYGNIFRMLWYEQKMHKEQRDKERLKLQIGHIEQRIMHALETEERIRIERHDLRHRLLTLRLMLEKGDYEEAKKYIDISNERLQQVKMERICDNPVLDIVFNLFFAEAKSKGILVESSLAIPKELSVEVTELSVVFANALENAINACEKLPEEERMIKCRSAVGANLMFQISNPFAGTIELDDEGRPVSKEPGHGIGTRSIVSFCKKYGGFADYEIKGQWLHLRIVIPK